MMPFGRFNAVHQYPHDESSSNLLDDVDFAPHEVFENGRVPFFRTQDSGRKLNRLNQQRNFNITLEGVKVRPGPESEHRDLGAWCFVSYFNEPN